MQGFVDADQLAHTPVFHHVVEVGNTPAVHEIAPLVRLRKDLTEIRHIYIARRNVRVRNRRTQQKQSARTELEIEHLCVTGRGQHFAVEVVRVITVLVHIEIRKLPPLQKPDLVRLPVALKELDRLVNVKALSRKRIVGFDDTAHLCTDRLNVVRGQLRLHVHRDVQRRADGIVDLAVRCGEQLAHGKEKDIDNRALVDGAAAALLVADQLDLSAALPDRFPHAERGGIVALLLFTHRDVV